MSTITSQAVVATADISMYRGDTKAFTVTCTRANAAINITGGSIEMTARRRLNDPTIVFQRAGVLTTPTSGIATITVLPADTTALPDEDTDLVYDVQLTEAAGTVSTVVVGTLTVLCDVSH